MENVNWTEETKREAREALVPEYTSSDESDYSEDEDCGEGNGPQMVLARYRVKHLSWEKTRLMTIKPHLDKIYLSSLPPHVKKARVPRVNGEVHSKKPFPENFIGWACR